MDTENAEIVNFVYTLEDGQIIEVYEGAGVPFPLVVAAENGVAETYGNDTESADQNTEYDFTAIEETLLDIATMVDTQNQNMLDGLALQSALVGVIIGFLACKELLQIWLQS